METSTLYQTSRTQMFGGEIAEHCPTELLDRYESLMLDGRFSWTQHYDLVRRLGAGGQGVVFLSQRRGADGFTLPVALKVFSPERYGSYRAYDDAMVRIAAIAARVALVQHDSLIDVQNFFDRNRIRLLEMEWVDGFDLDRLLTVHMLEYVWHRVSRRRWEYLNDVIITSGPNQPRLKPGIAICILRHCLSAVGALHRAGIVHGDLKPSNIMLKRTGQPKIIDVGSAFDIKNPPLRRTCTPMYAAPEVLEGEAHTPRSDLASLGYVLIEMLAGSPPIPSDLNLTDLLEAKRRLFHQLHEILPREVVCNSLLMNLCRGLIAPDPARRFPTAEAADMANEGAASFQRQLIKGDLASEYENEIRLWLKEYEELS